MTTTNKYINNPDRPSTPEQRLIEDLVVETIKFNGHTFLYIQRDAVNRDDILGDDLISEFRDARELEMYIQNVDGFDGDSELISRFGYQLKDHATVALAKRRFYDIFQGTPPNPQEGDLLYFPMTKGLFEITFVQHENPFYQASKIFVYQLNIQRFSFNHETFDTGKIEVDNVAERLENDNDTINDPFADNKLLQDQGDPLTDFDQKNPFGDY